MEFSIDRQRRLITATLEGMITREQVAEFYTRLAEATAQVATAPRQHLLLVDAQNMGIQEQEIVAMFSTAIQEDKMKAARVAVVAPLSLARNQVRRALIAARDDAAIFEDIAQARHWLLEGRAEAA